jgi:hypothetical protein
MSRMTASGTRASINRTARLAGGLYLSLVPLGFFSFVHVPSVVLVRGDNAATSRNIIASEWLFRAGTVSHLISQIIVVFLALALYRLLKPVNKDRAVIMVVLALLCVPISFLAEVNNLAALRLLSTAGEAAFTSTQLHAQAMQLLEMHRSAILLAQVFWGLWMLPLSSLVFTSGFLPKSLGIPVLIAAAGYLVDSGAHLLFPGRATIGQFTALGELLLPLWLVSKGVAVERWQRVALNQLP